MTCKTERNQAIAKAFLDGRTLASLAAEHGVCESRVSRIVRAQGVRLDRDALARRSRWQPGCKLSREHREAVRRSMLRRAAEGKRNGRTPIFADDPVKREQYLDLRAAMGAPYARQAMGLG